MLNYRRRLAAALTPAALANSALAHHPGGRWNAGGAGPVFAIRASTLDEDQTAVGVMFEYVRLRTLCGQTVTSAAVSGNEGVHDLKTIESTSAILAYGTTQDLTMSIRVPWVGRTGRGRRNRPSQTGASRQSLPGGRPCRRAQQRVTRQASDIVRSRPELRWMSFAF